MRQPQTLLDIPTPALIVDVAALERNIQRMAAFFASGPCRLRPHFKAHKTPEIARRQLAAGSCVGLTCATVSEAEMVAGLTDDILIANEIVGPGKCERVAKLAERHNVTIAVDSVAGLEAMSAAAIKDGVTVGVLIDLNVGQTRCGLTPGLDALALARRVALLQGVRLRGVMGYEGHLQPIRERAERERRTREAMAALVATARLIEGDGLPCDVVSGGGTGTYDISGRVPGVTEIQAGSYVLMDSDYGSLDLPFEQAFHLLGTVVSRPDPGRCVADCGHKSATKDHGNPVVDGMEGATVLSLNDEHATIGLPAGSRIAVGDRVRLRPSHTDPTVNLHDVFYAIEGERVLDVWPIAARGYPEHRAVISRL
ncbi:MAG: DSD1 family PLP-dependent enzyme [Acidimicrobiia bacterium]|nr:DSD1 family PLP-dependent enzyme [Acidimicrobiia bacterium]